MTYGSTEHEKLVALLRSRSYRRAPDGEPFKLASGKLSMHFCDVKATVMSPDGLRLATAGFVYLAKDLINGAFGTPALDAVAGVALGGCPLATAFSLETGLDCLYVRKEAKDHGTKKLLEGPPRLKSGRVLLLEDVCTTGGSSLQAVRTLRDAGFEVACVASLVDREEGDAEAFAEAGVPFRRLMTLSEISG